MVEARLAKLFRVKDRGGWLLSLFAVGISTPATTFSQTSLDSAAEVGALEEIIVTARKVEESVQDIPMSVQVLSADLLDQLDLTRLFDLQFNVPGLVVNNLGLNGAGFSLRGVSDQGGSSLSVATHLNGVYLGNSNLAIARMFDLQRVEVLKGPQGTLYGRNATGGSINFITRAPEDNFSAHVEGAYGSFDTARVQGYVNLPFNKAALRVAYIGSEGDGFIRNSVDKRKFAEQDFWGLRASLLFNVNKKLRVNVVAQRTFDDGASGELWLPQPDNLADPSDIRLTTVTLSNPFLKNNADNVNVNIEYDLDFATLRSVTGYASSEIRDLDDCAGLPQLAGCVRSALPIRHSQWSQELQLVSSGSETVDWLLGAYFYNDDAWRNYFELIPAFGTQPRFDYHSTSDESTWAVFGQGTWHVAQSWSITAGYRRNGETHNFSTIGTGTNDPPTLVESRKDWTNDSWRLDVAYAVNDDALVYASVSTGFKSGGISNGDSFDPENLTAYETGLKSQWLDRRLTLNAAAYYYDFRDLQVRTATITDSGLIFGIDNAAKAEIYGIDADTSYRLSDRLNISGGVVWLPKREFVEYRNDAVGDTLSGNDVTRAPEWTAVVALDYAQPLRNRGKLAARLEYNYRSDLFYTTDNDPRFAQDAFSLLNLFLSFEPASEKWYVFASGRNLGNADYYNQVFLQSSPGYPDTYEAGFGYRF
ncbi:MAG: TonB-dependent receptor [Gammaproteobacteria bacterium]|nr:TonB-dependent receptor [Gammaproteobacteria bacterium]MDH3374083.1 TonB-dependent receptor [Gammaproteobacteria bacterium]MDH3408886.1 TonB-dependent receptor [Gammaproteobacteria bacterium]